MPLTLWRAPRSTQAHAKGAWKSGVEFWTNFAAFPTPESLAREEVFLCNTNKVSSLTSGSSQDIVLTDIEVHRQKQRGITRSNYLLVERYLKVL